MASACGATRKLFDFNDDVHNWYQFVLSYPPYLVRDYLERFGVRPGDRVLDPFSGTGTTVVECKKAGIEGIGVEANRMACFASQVKTDWSPKPEALRGLSRQIADACTANLKSQCLTDQPRPFQTNDLRLNSLPDESLKLLIKNSISPVPLHKVLTLRNQIAKLDMPKTGGHLRLGLAKTAVESASNLRFGPEVGVGKIKRDAAVISPWLRQMETMAEDLGSLQDSSATPCRILHADSRQIGDLLEECSVDAVITSPPYPNEKDYSRTTRLESVLLGFMRSKRDLRAMKEGFIRSNTRNVYVKDDDDQWVERNESIQQIAEAIEARRIKLKKTSGFERLYHRVTKLYFGGMARHLRELSNVLKPGALLAYVVGDQASYLRIMIRTGQLLAEVAEHEGYQVESIDLFRTRFATATGEDLREEVVVLRWPGKRPS
ncbi:MAG TPA: DNA methyltransferase [Acidobacteriota bacterium]|nr:DNA methyltransferase [Acidobacteriota bacterium]